MVGREPIQGGVELTGNGRHAPPGGVRDFLVGFTHDPAPDQYLALLCAEFGDRVTQA